MGIGLKQLVTALWLTTAALGLAACDGGSRQRAAAATQDGSGSVATPTSDSETSSNSGSTDADSGSGGDTSTGSGAVGGGGGGGGEEPDSNGDGGDSDGADATGSDSSTGSGSDAGTGSGGDGASGDGGSSDDGAGGDASDDGSVDGSGSGASGDDSSGSGDDGATETYARLELNYANATLPQGLQQAYRAYGIPADGGTPVDLTQQAQWSVSDAGIARIGNTEGTRGLLEALAVGSVVVTVTFEAHSAQAELQVSDAVLESITVTPDGETLFEGQSKAYTALGAYSDGSEQDITTRVSWTVEDDATIGGGNADAVASISNADSEQGLLHALAAGDVLAVATLDGLRGAATVEVIANTLQAITLSPGAATLPKGLSLPFEASGTFADGTQLDISDAVLWQSSDAAVATLDAQGLASGHALGTVTITASLSGAQAHATLEVTAAALDHLTLTPADMTLPVALQQPYTAIATFTDSTTLDVTRSVVWSSSNPEVASIGNGDAAGLATTHANGSTTISAVLGAYSSSAYTTTLTVDDSLVLERLEVDPATLTCGYGQRYAFHATGVYVGGARIDLTQQVRWTSSHTKLVSIGLTTGLAKFTRNPNRGGDAQIRATLDGLLGTAAATKIKDSQACTTAVVADAGASTASSGKGKANGKSGR